MLGLHVYIYGFIRLTTFRFTRCFCNGFFLHTHLKTVSYVYACFPFLIALHVTLMPKLFIFLCVCTMPYIEFHSPFNGRRFIYSLFKLDNTFYTTLLHDIMQILTTHTTVNTAINLIKNAI